MIKAHKIRLHPTPEQAVYFAKAAGTARFAYNWGLEQWTLQYQEYKAGKRDKKPNALELKKTVQCHQRGTVSLGVRRDEVRGRTSLGGFGTGVR